MAEAKQIIMQIKCLGIKRTTRVIKKVTKAFERLTKASLAATQEYGKLIELLSIVQQAEKESE